MSLKDKCTLIDLKEFGDDRGKLVIIEGGISIPFEIKRVFYIYGTDQDVVRGKHANRNSEFILINVSGSSKVRLTDGVDEFIVSLDKPRMGLYIPNMVWKDMYDFSEDSILLCLASTNYDPGEYIRVYEDFLQEINNIKYV